MSGPPPADWQTSCKSIKNRGEYLLESGLWSDCKFIVGMEPNQQVIECHKLFLAMASPVFQAMFYGGMPEKNPITILDVQPEAFKALLEYIYTDKINLTSFDQACELCYGAKKYMLPHLVEECTKYLWSDLKPKNACRAYEFAKLFEEPKLMDKCLLIIKNETEEVLKDASFEDVETGTILTMLDQEYLTISSELELFQALTRLAAKQNSNSSGANAKVPRLDGIGAFVGAGAPSNEPTSPPGSSRSPSIRDCLMKIRFLTLTPQQFAEGPAVSNLLTQSEKFAILMNISSPSTDVGMPPGFSKSVAQRRFLDDEDMERDRYGTNYLRGASSSTNNVESMEFPQKHYCIRKLLRQTELMNSSVLDCTLTFQCDRNVCVYGIQVPAQIKLEDDSGTDDPYPYTNYTELLYAHLLDSDGARLTYTHFTSRVGYYSLMDISFNRPIFIQKNKTYKIGVVLNKTGWYPMGTYPPHTAVNGVVFTFGPQHLIHQAHHIADSRDGLVRSIMFSCNSADNNGSFKDNMAI